MSAATKPVQLQINQSGSWRACLDMDIDELPIEFEYHVDQLLRIVGMGTKGRARLVEMQRNNCSKLVPCSPLVVLNTWTQQEGWVS